MALVSLLGYQERRPAGMVLRSLAVVVVLFSGAVRVWDVLQAASLIVG
ncbi:hypothetical protein KAI46_09205 [bacterium]|nr:hypothetical protein [bacterium]